MRASWNQWGGTLGSGVGNYSASNYPGALPPTVGNFTSMPPSNPFSLPATSALSTPAPTSSIPPQYPMGNPMYGQQSQQQQQQQQQWQQWEQWQQQYAQWHQQYGDKYQGPVPTSGIMQTSTGFPSVPPLPQCAPTIQPPPPDSVPPPSDKNNENNKRPLQDANSKDETKKLKLGKGSKSENVDDLIEQEKTFDGQFKSWEASFLKWKEQNANHPDKTQYKEYEAKWESWREQLLQKREQLRKKREAKEAEIAAAAAAAKEAALATSNVSSLQQTSFSSNMINPNNPYSNMYAVPSAFPHPDLMPVQTTSNFVSNFSMFNVPPPPSVPQMPNVPPVGQDSQNMLKLSDGPKSTQTLEFLSSASSNTKSIPGLDLAGSDKNLNSAFPSSIPSNSALFSYNQDVTKPLHTSDDKPFNFPAPSQSNFPNEPQTPFGRGRPPTNTLDQFSKTGRFSQFDGPPPRSNQMDRSPSFDDRFRNKNFKHDTESRFSNDSKFSSGRNNNFRGEPPDRAMNKFGSSSFTPNFSSDKFAKYLEDEYDDSRFRDPEPPAETQFIGNRSNYQNRDGNFNDYKQNFGRSDNSFNFNDRGRGNFDRNKSTSFDRNKADSRFDSFGRGGKSNQFTRGANENVKDSFGRGSFNRGSADVKSSEPIKPVSLLDLPPMKPPEFEETKTLPENPDISSQPEDNFGSFFPKNNKFPYSKNESDQNFYSNHESIVPAQSIKSTFNSAIAPDVSKKSSDSVDLVSQEITHSYVPSKIYEYDHISRNDNPGNSGVFEPVYIFDYSHGKKKINDHAHELLAPISKAETLRKMEEPCWDGESWDEVEKNEKIVPLPPRIRNSFPEQLKPDTAEKKEIPIAVENSNTSKTDGKIISLIRDEIERKQTKNEVRQDKDMFAEDFEDEHSMKLIDDLLYPPGRMSRPTKLIIIMRGAPGSGKTFIAKLIKDKETEMGGSAPRILSLDDYFTVENDVKSTDQTTGKIITKKEMQYEYDAALEPSYQESLLKSFKKTVSDGFFPFIIVDCVNDKLKKYEEMYNFAKSKGFQVFICEMNHDLAVCAKRNLHNRSEEEISKIITEWEKTPFAHILLDIQSLLKSASVIQVDLTDNEETSKNVGKIESDSKNENDEKESADIQEKPTKDIPDEKEEQTDKETSLTESVKSDPVPVPAPAPVPASMSGSGYPRRARATFRGTPRMPRFQGNHQFLERRGFGGPTWRRGWPSRR